MSSLYFGFSTSTMSSISTGSIHFFHRYGVYVASISSLGVNLISPFTKVFVLGQMWRFWILIAEIQK